MARKTKSTPIDDTEVEAAEALVEEVAEELEPAEDEGQDTTEDEHQPKTQKPKAASQDAFAGLDMYDPASEQDAAPRNAVIYGVPGSGKTRLAATAYAPLIMDFEEGAAASVADANNPRARVVRIRSMDDVRRVYRGLASGKHNFDTVVLDPLGELQRMVMEDTVRRYAGARRQYDDLPTMADWQKGLADLVKLVTAFRSLPMHTVVLAHAEVPEHEEDVVKPLVSGKKFLPFLLGSMDLLGYLTVDLEGDTQTRYLQTVNSATVMAKNRGGLLPPVIENPVLSEIFDVMEGRA